MKMAKQLKETREAVARLTLWQMKMDAMSDQAGSEVEEVNPFSTTEPDPSACHPNHHNQQVRYDQQPHPHIPKMLFPKFDDENPRIWVDKCHDYFTLYNIPNTMKTSTASLHLEDNAAKWYQVYKLQNGVVSWSTFTTAVETKFGAYDYRSALEDLLELKQTSSVEEYTKEFEALRFQVSMHNPGYDEVFFASHFIKGLKEEIRAVV